jgi:hypothetical protein
MRSAELAKQHGNELAPTAEATAMPLGFMELDGILKLEPREQLQDLTEDACYSGHERSHPGSVNLVLART